MSVSSGKAPVAMKVQVNPTGLSAGTYSGTITVTALVNMQTVTQNATVTLAVTGDVVVSRALRASQQIAASTRRGSVSSRARLPLCLVSKSVALPTELPGQGTSHSLPSLPASRLDRLSPLLSRRDP